MLIRHAVCRYLEERGFQAESATNGVDALEMLKSIQPEIIITDLQMPKMDGHHFIRALKAKPGTAEIPIVILAGKKSEAQSETEKQANYIIFKDIDIETQLHKALEIVLHPPATAAAKPSI